MLGPLMLTKNNLFLLFWRFLKQKDLFMLKIKIETELGLA